MYTTTSCASSWSLVAEYKFKQLLMNSHCYFELRTNFSNNQRQTTWSAARDQLRGCERMGWQATAVASKFIKYKCRIFFFFFCYCTRHNYEFEIVWVDAFSFWVLKIYFQPHIICVWHICRGWCMQCALYMCPSFDSFSFASKKEKNNI